MSTQRFSRFGFVAILATLLFLSSPAAAQQPTLAQLETKLQKQYEEIYDLFANGPAYLFSVTPAARARRWQHDLADAFYAAELTIGEILKLHPPDEAYWSERRDTMQLYANPVSPPETREIFGKTEVEKKARLIDAPAADYPAAALAAKAKGEVRLRLVLAADGTVKYIFPMKPLKHGLTEAAIEAAKKIRFEPAIRKGKPASQFSTLSYVFKDGKGHPPEMPEREFAF
jgi:TonB family protein